MVGIREDEMRVAVTNDSEYPLGRRNASMRRKDRVLRQLRRRQWFAFGAAIRPASSSIGIASHLALRYKPPLK